MTILEVLQEAGVTCHLGGDHPKSRDGWVNCVCCYCSKDPYLGFNLAFNYCNCWSCGPHPIWEAIHFLTSLPVKDCFAIAKQSGESQPSYRIKKAGTLKIPSCVEGMNYYHRQYLVRRGFLPDDILRLWRVGGIGMFGPALMRWRVYIPIHLHGKVVSWTTRTIKQGVEPRYYSAKDEDSDIRVDDLLYGIDYVRNSVVIVEGPLDVWAVGPGAVSLLGQNLSEARLDQLSRIPVRYVAFDAESDAQRRAEKLANSLSVFSGATHIVRLESGNDPASISQDEIKELRQLLV
jgi:hypothetical protein